MIILCAPALAVGKCFISCDYLSLQTPLILPLICSLHRPFRIPPQALTGLLAGTQSCYPLSLSRIRILHISSPACPAC